MGQVRKRIKTLSLTSQRFGQDFARQVRIRHAMAAAALGIINVIPSRPTCGRRDNVSRKFPVQA